MTNTHVMHLAFNWNDVCKKISVHKLRILQTHHMILNLKILDIRLLPFCYKWIIKSLYFSVYFKPYAVEIKGKCMNHGKHMFDTH